MREKMKETVVRGACPIILNGTPDSINIDSHCNVSVRKKSGEW